MKVRIERKIYNFLSSKYFNLSIIPVLWCLIILTWFKHVDIFDAMNYGILIFGFYMNCFCIMVALNNPTINNGKEEKIYYNQKEIN